MEAQSENAYGTQSAASSIIDDLFEPSQGGLTKSSGDEARWAAEAVERYLIAYKNEAAAATAALAKTVRWRRETVPLPPRLPRCDACQREATSHCITCVGLLNDGRPVIYLSPPRARDLGTASCTQHLISELEAAFSIRGCASAGVWFVDLRGFSLLQSGMNPGLGLAYVRLLSDHYPERLSTLLLVQPPYYFELFLSALRPFLDARTAAKIVTLHSNEEVESWIARHADDRPGEAAGDDGGKGGDKHHSGEDVSVGEWLREAFRLEPAPGNLPPRLPASAPPAVQARGVRG